MKNCEILLIFAQNIDRGYAVGSSEHPRSMFRSKREKTYVYPYKPQFYYIKVGWKGV